MNNTVRPKKVSFLNLGFTLWFLISFMIVWFLFGKTTEALLITIVLYAISIGISLTPAGEWSFRLLSHVRPLANREEIDKLTPIFNNVYSSAREQAPWISNGVQLYITDDIFPNAAALGKRTIFVTRGLMINCNDEEIAGVLGHEFGHLAAGDTMAAIVATVGNFILAAILGIIRFVLWINSIFADIAANDGVGSFIRALIRGLDLVISICIFVGIVAAMYSSRKMEFEADKFSCHLGFGQGLMSFMQRLEMVESNAGRQKLGVMAALTASHPKTAVRIGVIEKELQNIA